MTARCDFVCDIEDIRNALMYCENNRDWRAKA